MHLHHFHSAASLITTLSYLPSIQCNAQAPHPRGPMISSTSAQQPAFKTIVIRPMPIYVNSTSAVINRSLVASDAANITGTLSAGTSVPGTSASDQLLKPEPFHSNGTGSTRGLGPTTGFGSPFPSGIAPVVSAPSIDSLLSSYLPSSLQSMSGTASRIPAVMPGSTGSMTSISATTTTIALAATTKRLPDSDTSHTSATTTSGSITVASSPFSGSPASAQKSQFRDALIGFVNGGRSWASDLTLPAVKTKAAHEVKNMLGSTENMIKSLGGGLPPSTHACSGVGKTKRFFDLLGKVESLSNDALGLANCIDDIITDISSEIGPLSGPPPASVVIPKINAQLDALQKASEEEEDEDNEDSSTSKEPSSTASHTGSSSTSSIGPSSLSSAGSSSSSSALGSCATFAYPADDISQWEGDPHDTVGIPKRNAAKGSPEERHTLANRAGNFPAITSINLCNFPPFLRAVQPAYSSLKSFLSLGERPSTNEGAGGQVFKNAAKWYVKEFTSGSPGFRWYRSLNQEWDGIPACSKQSIDHVYEKQLIRRFLEQHIDNATFTCSDMLTVFFPCGENKMQKIFDQLPGMQLSDSANMPKNINPGFAGLEQSINGVKGYMFDKAIYPPSARFTKARLKNTETKIATIQDLVMLFGVIKDADFQAMFDVTNNRVYQAFSGFDYLVTNNSLKMSNGTGLSATWASKYKTWMTNYLAEIVTPAWTWASATRDDLETQIRSNTTIDPDVKAAQLAKLAYIKTDPGFSQSAFICDFALTWQPGRLNVRELYSSEPKVKRDGTCSLAPSPSDTVSTTAIEHTQVSLSTPATLSPPSLSTPTTSDTVVFTDSPSISFATIITTTPSACTGNYVEGNCIGASFPSELPYSGIQGPVCQKVDSTPSSYLRINSDKAKQAAADYCDALAQQGVVLDAQATAPKPFSVPNAAENAGQLVLSVIFDVSACPTDKSQIKLDFTKMSATECQNNFYLFISEVCVQDTGLTAYNPDFTLEGGDLLNDCGLFSLAGQPVS